DRSAGLELYHRDEEFSRGVVEHFAYNLDAMVSLCSAARVPVFLVNPASNLKDFSPFKSEHTTGLTMIEKSKIDTEIARAADLVKKSQFDAALLVLDNAVREDPLFAETHFWRGRALLGKGLHEQARASFVKARDLDVCPLRCITPIEEKIAQIAERRGVPLIRFRESLERIAAETGDRSGVPGNESFLDHVHPTIERYQLLGEQLLQEMVERGMVKPSRELTAQDRSDVYRTVVKTLDPEFLASKDLNLAKTLRWAGKKDEAREALKRVAALLPGNAEVHKMMGSYLLDDANYDEAIQEYSEAVRLSGGDPTMEFSLAVAYQTSGRPQEAMEIYKRLADKEQTSADAAANLATLHLEQGRVELAQQVLEKGLKSNPESDSLFAPYGLALAMTGKVDEAIPWMLRAVRAEPGNPRHLYNLAGMYAMSGRTSEGLAALNQAVD
ncbi:MAG: tetratricopeptide repeat protein, partial [Deltaproteobacteria bacterium]|nr:tetratricopeptide repeat protein [Deltaproteobacteria bacterium]